jgi:4-carboxymuconolactone decarboxylase
MAPRIAPVRDPDPETADILSKTLVGEGPPLNVFTTLARHPRLLKRFNVLGGFFLTRGSLPARDREIVILRSAWRSGSEYEFGQHVLIGRQAGLTDDEIRALATESGEWPAHEAALVAVADEVDRDAAVSDATWEALQTAYDEAQMIEVILLAGFYRMLAALLNTVGVERDDGVPGWPATG